MTKAWERDGRKTCLLCERPIVYDPDSGYWLHAEFDKVDGRNGLFCQPEMWTDGAIRRYAEPA